MRRPLLLIAPIAVALIAAGCGSSSKTTPATSSAPASSSSSAAASVTVSTKSVSGVGTVLVNAQGKTLYVFKPDNAKQVTCTGSCAAVWPPVMVPSGGKPSASGGVKASMLSSDPDPSGGSVATYNGWPLYSYVADTGPGTAKGEGVNLNGGLWYVISPSGQPVTSKGSSSSTSTTYKGY